MATQRMVVLGLALCAACGGSSSKPGDVGTPVPVLTFQTVNNCKDTDYSDQSASATPTVQFGGALGLHYSAPCVTISAGQTLTFAGNFSVHPLKSGAAPAVGGANGNTSPVPDTATGTTLAVAFPNAGFYPYYCVKHQGAAMYGAIQVK